MSVLTKLNLAMAKGRAMIQRGAFYRVDLVERSQVNTKFMYESLHESFTARGYLLYYEIVVA